MQTPEPCRVNHRTYSTRARCEWPYADFVRGEGRWAVLAWCGHLTVTLHPDHLDADQVLADLNAHGCSPHCQHRHRLVDLHWRHKAWTSKLARR